MDLLTLAMAKSLSGGKNIGVDSSKSTTEKTYYNFTLDDIKKGKPIIIEVEGTSDTYYYPDKIVVAKDAQGKPTTLTVHVSDSQYNETFNIDENGGLYKSCVITYKSEDGSTTLYTEEVCVGGEGTKENTETKDSTAQYDYVADGWSLTASSAHDDDALKNVVADRTVYASFDAILRSYDVFFNNTVSVTDESNNNMVDEDDDLMNEEDGVLLEKQHLYYGDTPVYTGDTPTQEETDAYRYEFDDWNPTIEDVTGEASYQATYTKIEK